ncbi:MAG TPA: glycosyltransferase family 39 protein [Mycobacteriales bacterium]|nr:glycosyltransferase family 39 protein [Mycobacteriales bacterium]
MTTSAYLPTTPAPPVPATPGRLRRLVRGRAADPAWARPTLWLLLAVTAVLYLVSLGDSGWANSFYSAAVQAGSASWKAFFFGSSDAANSITVDKPPASLWVMALSVRIFGLSSWSMLVPQALMGVASVGLLHATVRRWFGAGTGLLAGLLLALSPVAALMFRFNNPDALLVLVMTAAAYAVTRGIEDGRRRWIVLAGALLGLGFLTKQLQAFLVLPGLALAYLVAAPGGLGRRILDLLTGGLALIVAAGWWVAIVELVPASARPYIGGSQHNSILELTLGYNGFGRLTGNETGSVGGGGRGGGNGGGMWGSTGITRLFGSEFGGQISWLLPAALIVLVAGFVLIGRSARTDRRRAGLLLWGGWLVVTGLTFSFMSGIIHPYYMVALSPAVAAVVAIGVTLLWRHRSAAAGLVLSATSVITAIWAFRLLERSPDWHPWLRWAIVIAGLLGALGLALAAIARSRPLLAVAGVLALIAGVTGPLAYTLQTVSTPHSGAIVSAGPASTSGFGGPGGFGGRPPGAGQGGAGGGRFGGPPGGGQNQNGAGPNQNAAPTFPGGNNPGRGTGRSAGGFGKGGGAGGLLNGSESNAALTKALLKNADSYTWVAAAIGSNSASGYQLATQKPVMPIGGFNGSDPSPTLAQFKAYVAAGKIHYFIAGGMMGGGSMGGSNASSAISSWVQKNFTSSTIGGTTVYDLSEGTTT